jgi:hypothetical protein
MKPREYIKAEENFLIEKEKRYQRKNRRPQEEYLTTLKETKKPPKSAKK